MKLGIINKTPAKSESLWSNLWISYEKLFAYLSSPPPPRFLDRRERGEKV